MTYTGFMAGIEQYYGPYANEFTENTVLAYIMANFRETQLDDLFKRVVMKFSNQYKVPPGISVFQELNVNKSRLRAEAIEHWKRISDIINIYRDIFFEDIRIQAAIEAMGGWVDFCNRNPQYEVLDLERFIDLYILYTENPPTRKCKLLMGISDKSEIIYYGDRERCQKLLEGVDVEQEDLMERIGYKPKMIEDVND